MASDVVRTPDKPRQPPSKVSTSERQPPSRTCSSMVQTAVGARQRYDMRVVVRSAAVDAIEERVAIGLEPVDVGSALLLGHSCRYAEPAEIALINHSLIDQKRKVNVDADLENLVETPIVENIHSPSAGSTQAVITDADAFPSLPPILLTAQGSEVVPIPNEYARLEGFHWLHTERCGKGSVFCIERFGNRGECVLCPAFCTVRPPSSEAYLEAESSSMHWSASFLQRVLDELCQKVNNKPRIAPKNYLSEVENAPSVDLVVPAGKLVMKPDPSSCEIRHQAARRHALFIGSVEMGAKLSICAVPPAETQTGDLDKIDADLLENQIGAKVFCIAGQRGRLCFRHLGGPQLDAARVAGKTLDQICTYIRNGWSDSLGAMPTTWVRLSVEVSQSISLEEAISPPGPLSTTDRNNHQYDICSYCGDSPVVGYKVLRTTNNRCRGMAAVSMDKELDSLCCRDDLKPLCGLCSGFIQGVLAPVTKFISASVEPATAMPRSETVLRDAGSFSALSVRGLQLWSDILARRKALHTEASNGNHLEEPITSTLAREPESASDSAVKDHGKTHEAHLHGWEDEVLPSGAVVLAVSALVSLVCPTEGFEQDEVETRAQLESQICQALRCRSKTAQIVAVAPELDYGGVLLSIMILHPATVEPNISTTRNEKQEASIDFADEDLGPLAPLLLYRRLAKHLTSTLTRGGGRGTQLVAGDALRAIAPCSIIFCPGAQTTPQTNNAVGTDVGDRLANEEDSLNATLGPNDMNQSSSLCEHTSLAPCQTCDHCEDVLDQVQAPSHAEELSTKAVDLSPLPDEEKDEMACSATEDVPKRMVSNDEPLQIQTNCLDDDATLPIAATLSLVSSGTALSALLSSFNPTPYQLTLRLRELTAAHLPKRCRQLLSRWGAADIDGGSKCAMAVVSRDAQRFGGQSALDLAIVAGHRATMDALLDFVPEYNARLSPEGRADMGESPHANRIRLASGSSLSSQYESREEVSNLINAPNPMSGYTALYAVTMYPNEHTRGTVERLVQRYADINACGFPSVLSKDGMPQTYGLGSDATFTRLKETALVVATRRGDESLIRKLVELRADVNAKAADGVCILQTSIERRDRDILQTLLASPNCNLNETDLLGRTALVTAIHLGCIDLAKDLILARCNVDARDRNGAAPILHAIKVHDGDLCRLLLENSADKNARDPADGSHVLHLAAQTRNLPLLQELLTARADIHARHSRDGRTTLHFAAAFHMPSIAKMLIDLSADVDASSFVGDTPLRLAVASQELDTVEVLCQGRADPNRTNRSGCAPIHAAVTAGDGKLTEVLVAYGADVHLADSRRWCPIHYSASGGNGDIVDCLISSGANPYVRSFHGRTARDLGQSSALVALSQAAAKNPPPLDLLEPGPRDAPRLKIVWQGGKVRPPSSSPPIASRPQPHLASHASSTMESCKLGMMKTDVAQSKNEDLAQQLSVNSMTESSMSSTLPPIAMASKVRAGGTPRGSLRSGDMKLRLIGMGCNAQRQR